jgi:hypothetical protein
VGEAPENVDDATALANVIDQLTAILPGFAARIRTGEITPELYIQYGDMLRGAGVMCWSLAPDFGRLADELFEDDPGTTSNLSMRGTKT